MQERLSRQQLILLAQKLQRGEGSEEEIEQWCNFIDRSVPCPVGYFFDLIFYPHLHASGENPTAEEIVEKALSYKPIQL